MFVLNDNSWWISKVANDIEGIFTFGFEEVVWIKFRQKFKMAAMAAILDFR